MHRSSKFLATAALLTTLGASATQASAAPPPATCPIKKPAYTGNNPRFQRGTLDVGGVPYRYSVLLPSDYTTSSRSYPVLYWLHGASGDPDTAMVDPTTPGFMENLTANQPVIVVMPEGGFVGMYSDWGTPGHQYETFHMRLIRHIDATYRTKPRRADRAVAGYSMGGMGAIAYAARHRRVFSIAASFSGLLDTSYRSPAMKVFLSTAGPAMVPACEGQPAKPFGPWGDPATHQPTWERHNPTALVDKLRRTSVYVTTGDGSPCDQQDALVLAKESPTNPLKAMEPFVHEANETFHRTLTEQGITHRYRSGCGIHSWRYWENSLTAWWPVMMKSFGTTARRAPKH
jgi:S-formylglutathione hydrolase FrmB